MASLRLTRRFFIDGHTHDADEVVLVAEERARHLVEAGVGVRYFAAPTPPPKPDPPSGKPARRANKS